LENTFDVNQNVHKGVVLLYFCICYFTIINVCSYIFIYWNDFIYNTIKDIINLNDLISVSIKLSKYKSYRFLKKDPKRVVRW